MAHAMIESIAPAANSSLRPSHLGEIMRQNERPLCHEVFYKRVFTFHVMNVQVLLDEEAEPNKLSIITGNRLLRSVRLADVLAVTHHATNHLNWIFRFVCGFSLQLCVIFRSHFVYLDVSSCFICPTKPYY